MKTRKKMQLFNAMLGIGSLILGVVVSTSAAAVIPEDPDTFLTFLEQSVPEDAISATAYYAAVDPDNKKTTYADWLLETGFINDLTHYESTEPFAENTFHAYATVTHKNETDLGFVRVVSIRCKPHCDARNPDIYSVIENYVDFDNAAARTNRLASVTMEWTSAADGTRPNRKFVVFYAYTGGDSRSQLDTDIGSTTFGHTIPFQPDLDTRGEKPLPGLCDTCHGGAPKKLKRNGEYRAKGNTNSLFLAMDLDNFGFDPVRPSLSRSAQESEYKKMNQVVLITHRGAKEFDEVAGFSRVSAGREVIEGWYGGPEMDEDIFDGEFVPPGWLPPYAPAEAEELYLSAVVPACRACHMQQDRSLDFATYEGFMVFEDEHKELVLSIECGLSDDSNSRVNGADDQAVMPLAKQTYDIFWNTSQVDVFKHHLGEVDCSSY